MDDGDFLPISIWSVGEYNPTCCIPFDDYHEVYNKRHFGLSLFGLAFFTALTLCCWNCSRCYKYTFIGEIEPKHQAARLFSKSGIFFPACFSVWQDDEGICIKFLFVLSVNIRLARHSILTFYMGLHPLWKFSKDAKLVLQCILRYYCNISGHILTNFTQLIG